MAVEDLLAAIQAGPQSAPEEEIGPAKPIGVPASFQPYMYDDKRKSASGRPAPRFVPDPYFDGAQYAPRTLSPEARARLQRVLQQAGLYEKNDTYKLGVWDQASANAYKKVLSYANQGGIKADDALQELLEAPQYKSDGTLAGEGGSAAQPEPGNVSRTTNPMTIEQQVQQVARERLGRKLKVSEVAKFAALYQGMEKGYNAKMNAAEDTVAAGGDVTIEEQAPVGAAADQFIDSNFANEAGGQDAYGYLGALKNLLGG